MPAKVTVEVIPEIREMVREVVARSSKRLRHLRYCDLRLEVDEGKGAASENGMDKFAAEDYGFALGVRVIAGEKTAAAGYVGRALGAADLPSLSRVLRAAIDRAYARALASAQRKEEARGQYGALAEALYSTELAPIDVRQDTVAAQYQIDPRSVSLEEIARHVRATSEAVAAVDGQILYSHVGASTGLTRQLFCSSEGADIDQSWAVTQGVCFVVAQGQEAGQEMYDYVGHQRGWEVITQGIDEGSIQRPALHRFSLDLARDTVALANARPLPATDKDVVVVTNPHYNALLVHEIVGHPTEADRALKFETGYAGRSWLLKDVAHNQLGQRVGSHLLTAFTDATLSGFGHYLYDDEGTPAKRVTLIDKGIFRGFMNSRQTAALLGAEPNGSYKATDASLVPLIRMSNTVFAGGNRDPQDIIREVDHGYYVVGHRIPSIAESRENFRITAMKVFEIRNGELGEMFRDGGLTSDSRDFFLSVDAVGNDFRMFPIPNCGKGVPMQTKRMSNGGPTLRGRARLTGVP
jgi:TldD protein